MEPSMNQAYRRLQVKYRELEQENAYLKACLKAYEPQAALDPEPVPEPEPVAAEPEESA